MNQPIKSCTNLYSASEAAAYIGISANAFSFHFRRAKHIEAAVFIGRIAGFNREQLDAFKARRRGRGRPSLTERAA